MQKPREKVGQRYKTRLAKLAVARPGRILWARILFSLSKSYGKPREDLNR